MIGQTLSHYRITAALGAGGMGEVYRATDSNLGRDVAIKVLPPEVAQDPDRLGRFKREAHLLAALNHPNIAAIYGLEEADGKPFLALELVEGEDLKEGRFEVYVEPFRRRGEQLRVSDNGGGQPRWRGDGKELFYLSLSGAIASVSVRDAGQALELGRPTTLVPADRLRAAFQASDYDDWDVTPDGQRFLVKVPDAADERPRIHVLLDWTSVGAR